MGSSLWGWLSVQRECWPGEGDLMVHHVFCDVAWSGPVRGGLSICVRWRWDHDLSAWLPRDWVYYTLPDKCAFGNTRSFGRIVEGRSAVIAPCMAHNVLSATCAALSPGINWQHMLRASHGLHPISPDGCCQHCT